MRAGFALQVAITYLGVRDLSVHPIVLDSS